MLGQGFSPEVQAGHWSAEAVLSYGFWRRRFGADPNIAGRIIHLNTVPFTIVGVAPPSFFGLVRGSDYELRIPLLPDGRKLSQIGIIDGLNGSWWGAAARLRPHQSMAEAEAAADAQLQAFLRTTSDQEVRDSGLRHIRLSSARRGHANSPYESPSAPAVPASSGSFLRKACCSPCSAARQAWVRPSD